MNGGIVACVLRAEPHLAAGSELRHTVFVAQCLPAIATTSSS